MIEENHERSGISQKLLRCWVIGKDSRKSDRFVEIEQFKLWSYMMFHKHGLRIRDISLWLWVTEDHYRARQEIYSRAPETLAVNKIGVFLFDENNGFSHVIHRYTPSEGTAAQEKILLSHISPELVAAGNYELTVHKGFCIKNNIQNLDKIVLGLSTRDQRIWYRER